MKKLPLSFYRRTDVLQIAEELLGKILVTRKQGILTSGRIVEVEAYAGVQDRASHAWGGRKTDRNRVMYLPGGVSYIYLCYGIHHLFNVVTGLSETPHAILIRALEPVSGLSAMMKRTGKKETDYGITSGPGNLSKALGLRVDLNGFILTGPDLYIAGDNHFFSSGEIAKSPRIGVAYAGRDALLPYRFYLKGNPWVSGKPK
ncbi:MAG: DNA-3-methyladenine glycosylase [Chitinophagaceae bacterium]